MEFPIEFYTRLESDAGIQAQWSCWSGNSETAVAIPPEFAGPGGGLSPEDLFNQALINCFVGTFKVYAEKSKVSFDKLLAQSKLVVAPDEQGRPVMKRLEVRVQIQNPSHPDRALRLAQKASESGFILNSVHTECHFEFELVQNQTHQSNELET